MTKIVLVALGFVVLGFVLDWFGVTGNVPRTVFLAVMLSSLGLMATRQYGPFANHTR